MFLTQERRLITTLSWLGVQENILGQEARRWLQPPLSFERIKTLLLKSDPQQLFTFSSHTIHHPQFSELIPILRLYKDQITMQISQADLHEKSDLFFNLAEMGLTLETIIYEPIALETQIVLSKATYQKINFKILALLNRHFSARDLFDGLYFCPNIPISLFFSKTTNSEDWLYLSPSQAVIRSEEARDCLNRLGNHNVKITTFNPQGSKEIVHDGNPFIKDFTAPSVGLWTLSALSKWLTALVHFIFIQPVADVVQVFLSKDIEQTRLYWSIKNRLIRVKNYFKELYGSSVNAMKWSPTKIRHSAFIIFNPTYWHLYSLTSRVKGHGVLYSTLLYWKSFRAVQVPYYFSKKIAGNLRHLCFIFFNRIFWALHSFVSKIAGQITLYSTTLYWKLFRVVQVPYYFSKKIASTLRHLCFIFFNRIFWALHSLVSKIVGQITLYSTALYWKLFRVVQAPYYFSKKIAGTLRHLCFIFFNRIFWTLHSLVSKFAGQTILYSTITYWKLFRAAQTAHYSLKRIVDASRHLCFVFFNYAYWTLYSRTLIMCGFGKRTLVILYWSLQNTFMFLAWPLRKIYWFGRFQYYKRILGQAYEN